jgi:hypothetical protein
VIFVHNQGNFMVKSLFKWIFLLIALWGSFQAQANPCLDYDNSGTTACQQSYVYDKATVYFKDANGIEQKFFAKRIVQKSNSALLHVDYDFVVNCITNCSDNTAVMNRYLWDWKNAVGTDSLYTKQSACDPNYESCCSRLTCGEVNSEPGIGDSTLSAKPNAETMALDVSTQSAAVDKNLTNRDAITGIFATSVALATEGKEVAPKVKANETTPTSVIMVKETETLDSVCYINAESKCEKLEGSVLVTENDLEAELKHNLGPDFNQTLNNFLYDNYLRNRPMSCSQTASCSKDGCSIVLTCSAY